MNSEEGSRRNSEKRETRGARLTRTASCCSCAHLLDTAHALAVSAKGPVCAVYADVLKMRIRASRKKQRGVPKETYAHERLNELYFNIIDEVMDDEDEDDEADEFHEDDEGQIDMNDLQGDLEHELGEPLWQVIDSMISTDLAEIVGRVRVPHHAPKGTDDYDGPWTAFWEFFRSDGAKTTSNGTTNVLPEKRAFTVAVKPIAHESKKILHKMGVRPAKTPPLRPIVGGVQGGQKDKGKFAQVDVGSTGRTILKAARDATVEHKSCPPSMAQKILQEFAFYEAHESRRNATMHTTAGFRRTSSATSADEQEQESESSSDDDDDDDEDDDEDDDDGDDTNDDREDVDSDDVNDNDGNTDVRQQFYRRGKEAPVTPRNRCVGMGGAVLDMNEIHQATRAFVEVNRTPPVFSFSSFADYKSWQNPEIGGRYTRGKQEIPKALAVREHETASQAWKLGKQQIVKVAAESPQYRWSNAVREHEAASHWRRRGKPHTGIDGGPLVHGWAECGEESLPPSAAQRRTSTPQSARANLATLRPATQPSPLSLPTPKPQPRRPASSLGAETHSARAVLETSRPTRKPKPGRPASGLGVEDLPQQQRSFHRPWSREGKRPEEDSSKAGKTAEVMEQNRSIGPIERFAKICRKTGVHPQPCTINFLGSLPPKMDMRGVGYADVDLLALAAALPYEGRIESVDLGENPRLSDASACTILRALAGRHADSLAQLRFDQCLRLGRDTIILCTNLLKKDLTEIQLLDISGIQVPVHEYNLLSFAIKAHKKLRDVRLAATGLGAFDKNQGQSVIANLVGNPHLEALEIGWNSLDAGAFRALGKGLLKHSHLSSLGLSNCGSQVDPALGGSPALVFLELLEKDSSLSNLDISNNGFDDLATLVMECAACRHPKLHHIDFSQNGLGLGGRRSLIRLFASVDCPFLSKLTANECRGGQVEMSGKNPFALDPSGSWELEMAQPAQRALLKLLLQRFSEGPNSLPPSKLMKSCTICRDENGEVPYNPDSLKRKGEKKVWDVPNSGKLNFEFCAGDILFKNLDAKKTPSEVVQTVIRRTRLVLTGRQKTLAVLRLIKGETDDADRNALLDAISRDFVLTPEQVKALCHTKSKRPNCAKDPAGTCCRLLPCLTEALHIRQAVLCTHNLTELVRVHTHGRKLLGLHLENPTGHYDFTLAEPADRATAERLLLLNRWETQVWSSSGRSDISQYQNLKNMRNEVYGGREFIWSAEEWGIFGDESLSFDYVSLRRPPKDAKVLSAESWSNVIDLILRSKMERQEVGRVENMEQKGSQKREFRQQMSGVSVEHQSMLKSGAFGTTKTSNPTGHSIGTSHLSDSDLLWALRSVSSRLWLECWQVREMLCIFNILEDREEILTFLCFRTLDWPVNNKMLRSKFQVKHWDDLRKRLGSVVMFPFFQPENGFFRLDLSIYEQRRCVSFLKTLSDSEHHKNLKWPRIDWRGPRANQIWDSFTSGMPVTWADMDRIPKEGLFEVTYTCSFDAASIRLRRQLASRWGGWANLPEEKLKMSSMISWWSVLDEVPREVIMVLEFLLCHFKSLGHAFDSVDTNKDKSLTYREFKEGFRSKMRELGFGLSVEGREALKLRQEAEKEERKAQRKAVGKDALTARRNSLSPVDSAGARKVLADMRTSPDLEAVVVAQKSEKDEKKSEIKEQDISSKQDEQGDGAQDDSKVDGEKKAKNNSKESKAAQRGAIAGRDMGKMDEYGKVLKQGIDDERLIEILTLTFKFLDPNNDAELSFKEFQVFEGIWRELKLTMWECYQHITDCFGTLENAWTHADIDESGTLEFEEFETLAKNWQFDGPVRQIFMYLDKDGTGSIGHDQWMQLESFDDPNLERHSSKP